MTSVIANRQELLSAVKSCLQPHLNNKTITRDEFKDFAKSGVSEFKVFPVQLVDVQRKIESLLSRSVAPQLEAKEGVLAETQAEAEAPKTEEVVAVPPAPSRKVPLTLSMLKSHMQAVKERVEQEQLLINRAAHITVVAPPASIAAAPVPQREEEQAATTSVEDELPRKRPRVEQQSGLGAIASTVDVTAGDDDLYGDFGSNIRSGKHQQQSGVLQQHWRAQH
jgi:hypothetical protein